MTTMQEDLIKLLKKFLENNNLEWEWFEKIEAFCNRYDLNIKYITEILNDPKVIPMIRGKSFEFTVQDYLSKLLKNYEVINPRLNSQIGFRDIDVALINKTTLKKYSVECKLAKKGSFQRGFFPTIEVKCMRSRTLGEAAAQQKSKLTGIPVDLLMVHNDQYIATDFDLVVTSIANAFYETDEDGLFFWSPTLEGQMFLNKLNINNQEDAFLKMYVARSQDLISNQINKIKCSRKKCKNSDCNFIPNYPKIYFDFSTGQPLPPWLPIDKIENFFE